MKLFAWLFFAFPVASALAAGPSPSLAVDKSLSKVSVSVHATVDSFVGKLDDYDTAIALEPGSGKIASVTFKFLFADLHTGKAERDKEMLRWENAPDYPEGTFVLTKLDPAGDNRFTVHGTLRIHGVTREIGFPVTIVTDGHVFSIDGEAPIDTREFGLPIIRKYGVFRVDPMIKIGFHLQALPASS